MPDAPRDISDPLSGQRWVFTRTGADTGGELLEAELHVSAGGFVREHVHPLQEETFTGVEGTFVLEIDGQTRTIGPGESVVIPPRTPHGFSAAPGPAQLHVAVRPALSSTTTSAPTSGSRATAGSSCPPPGSRTGCSRSPS